jgi:hypothetical protein
MTTTSRPVRTGQQTIAEDNAWAFCRICHDAFRRIRETLRYCDKCKNAFCEGEHGTFAYGHGTCVACGVPADYKEPRADLRR